MKDEEVDLSTLCGHTFACSCGRTHHSEIGAIEVSAGALAQLPGLVREYGYRHVFVVADATTHPLAGRAVCSLLSKDNIRHTAFQFASPQPSPDERTLGSLLMHLEPRYDLVIAVGSGTINDICRFVSHRLRIPYFIVGTAPSMDGYASSVAPLITDSLKTTYGAHPPQAIIADLDILVDAPLDMIRAGFGDMIGKFTGLCDWELSAIVNGEYYCPYVVSFMGRALERVVANRHRLLTRDPEAIAELTKGLILSGVAISYVGNSRPASGSEHQLAHFWEMHSLFAAKEPQLHGDNVALGALIVLRLYEYFRQQYLYNTRLTPEAVEAKSGPAVDAAWEQEIRRAFGPAAAGVLALENEAGKNKPAVRKGRIVAFAEQEQRVLARMEQLPSAQAIAGMMSDVKGTVQPTALGLDRQTVEDAIRYAKELRNRYTILQLLWDLDLLDGYARRVVDELF